MENILATGWDRLVHVLDSGGYARYDFSTASILLKIVTELREKYGSLEELHRRSSDPKDLERRLQEFKGVGPARAGYGSRGVNLYCLQDTAAATQNMLLAACALGLGTCWVGAFHEEEVRKVLRIPNGVRPVAIIPVGHAAEKPVATSRRPITEIVHCESFGQRSA